MDTDSIFSRTNQNRDDFVVDDAFSEAGVNFFRGEFVASEIFFHEYFITFSDGFNNHVAERLDARLHISRNRDVNTLLAGVFSADQVDDIDEAFEIHFVPRADTETVQIFLPKFYP